MQIRNQNDGCKVLKSHIKILSKSSVRFDALKVKINKEYEFQKINNTSKKILLVIGDNKYKTQNIQSEFENEYIVLNAYNAAMALDMCKRYSPDIIICNATIPGIDGYEFCRILKNDIKIYHIPVILLSIKSEIKNKIIGLETGADDFLFRPFEITELKARVKNLITNREKLKTKFHGNNVLVSEALAKSNPEKKFISEISKIIEENISDPEFDQSVLIKKAGLSRTNLYIKFKAATGQTASEFIRSVRLKKAAEILKRSCNLRISEIAYSVGFNGVAHFSTLFKKRFGMSPSEFVSYHNK